MHIVFLVPFVPHAQVPKAGGQFLHAYLEGVAEWAEVTVIAPPSRERSIALPRNVRLIELIPPNRRSGGFDVKSGLVHRALGLSPAPSLRRIIRAHLATPKALAAIASATIVEVQFSRYLPLARLVRAVAPNTPITAFEYDVFAQVLARRLSVSRGQAERIFLRLSSKLHTRREAAALNAVDSVLVLSEKDRQLLSRIGVQTPVHIVQPWVPVACAEDGPGAGLCVLLVGEFSRPVNSDAAHWFLDQVWPLIQRHEHGARLVLAGSAPPRSLRQRGGDSVEVTGYVPDLGQQYRRARVVVAPVRLGGGVRFKVLEAMAHGIPLVATSVAMEGITVAQDGADFGRVADTPEDMAEGVLRYLRDEEAGVRCGKAGQAWVRAHLSLDRTVSAGRRVYESLAQGRAPTFPCQPGARFESGHAGLPRPRPLSGTRDRSA